MPRSPRVAIPTALVLAALPALIPYPSLLGVDTESDTHTLVLWWYLQHALFALHHTWIVVLCCGLAVAALVLRLPRRYALVLPALLAVALVLSFKVVEGWMPWGTHGASIGALYQGITADHPDWVDRKVGPDANVALIWDGKKPAFTIWESEFFNRSIRTIYDLGTGPTPAGQFEATLGVDSHGLLRAEGIPVRAQYVLASAGDWLAGTPIAADGPHGMGLYRTKDGVRVQLSEQGVDGDGWLRPTATISLYNCQPGRSLFVWFGSDPKLFHSPQIVTATENGRRVGRLVVDPRKVVDPHFGGWDLPTHPRDGACRFTFRTTPTAIPAQVVAASTDERRLGVRFSGSPLPHEDRLGRRPLSHPRTGVGNYVRGSLAGLVEAAGDEHEVVAFAPVSKRGRVFVEEALAGIPSSATSGSCPSPTLAPGLEQARVAAGRVLRGAPRRVPLLRLDVSAPAGGAARDDGARPRPGALPGVGAPADACACTARSSATWCGRARSSSATRASPPMRCAELLGRPGGADPCRLPGVGAGVLAGRRAAPTWAGRTS